MKKPNREQVDNFVSKVDDVRKKVDEGVQQKVMPLTKGYEGVIIVVLAVVILASLSAKALMLGGVVAALMLLPMYYPKIMAKLNKPASDVTVVDAPKVAEEVKTPDVIIVNADEDKTK